MRYNYQIAKENPQLYEPVRVRRSQKADDAIELHDGGEPWV